MAHSLKFISQKYKILPQSTCQVNRIYGWEQNMSHRNWPISLWPRQQKDQTMRLEIIHCAARFELQFCAFKHAQILNSLTASALFFAKKKKTSRDAQNFMEVCQFFFAALENLFSSYSFILPVCKTNKDENLWFNFTFDVCYWAESEGYSTSRLKCSKILKHHRMNV